jgi:conjugal transfer pilin signal peptidase TrbI
VKPRFILSGILALAIMGTGVHWLRGHVKLAWNETESLPQHLFWVRTDQMPGRGDYVMFEPPAHLNSHYGFVKRVAGIAGDRIEFKNQITTVAGTVIGIVKKISRKGKPLHATPTGEIPPGFYFVHTDHRDSYDSRYQSIGLVPDARIIGRATPLF